MLLTGVYSLLIQSWFFSEFMKELKLCRMESRAPRGSSCERWWTAASCTCGWCPVKMIKHINHARVDIKLKLLS